MALTTKEGVFSNEELALLESEGEGDLLSMLDAAIGGICKSIVKAAMIVAALDKRDYVFPNRYNKVMLTLLRKIADGCLLPEVYLSFQWRWGLLKRVAHYSIRDQKALIDSESAVEVVVRGETSKYDTRVLPVIELDAGQINQVFGDDSVRSPEGQIAYLARLEQEKNLPKKARVDDAWTLHKPSKTVIFKKDTRVGLKELMHLASLLS